MKIETNPNNFRVSGLGNFLAWDNLAVQEGLAQIFADKNNKIIQLDIREAGITCWYEPKPIPKGKQRK